MAPPREHDSQMVTDSRIAPASVDLADAVVQGVRAGFGVLSLGLGVALRTLGESPQTLPRQPGLRMPPSDVADIVIDLGGVVASALQQVDLTQIVMQQVDLVGVAEYVVDAIDLPEIIRDSTGSVASEAVVGLRMQAVDADVVVGRVVDRMLRRSRQRRSEKAPQQVGSPDAPTDPATGEPV